MTAQAPVEANMPAADPESVYAKYWPRGPGLFKLNEQLVLQIPPQFNKFWLQRDRITGQDLVPRPPADIKTLTPMESVGFVMYLPAFEGFTPQNYQRDFDEDRVEVVRIAPASLGQTTPGAPGYSGPNVLDRIVKAAHLQATDFVSMHDLKCYADSGDSTNLACYGKRDSKLDEYMLLRVRLPPYEDWVRYPQMQTTYFSPRYGGLEISW